MVPTSSSSISIGAENFVSLGLTDVFIIKHDTTGNVVWVKSMGGVGDDQVNEIILDNNNNPTITGSFEGTALFNNLTINSNGLKDVFFSKYTSQGVAYWVQNIGGLGMDEGASIAMDISNNIFLNIDGRKYSYEIIFKKISLFLGIIGSIFKN